MGKLARNDTSKNGIIHSASKEVSVKLPYQFLHILKYKERLNELKGSTKNSKCMIIIKI